MVIATSSAISAADGALSGTIAAACVSSLRNKSVKQAVKRGAVAGTVDRLVQIGAVAGITGTSAVPALVSACTSSKKCKSASLAFMKIVSSLSHIPACAAGGALACMVTGDDVTKGAVMLGHSIQLPTCTTRV